MLTEVRRSRSDAYDALKTITLAARIERERKRASELGLRIVEPLEQPSEKSPLHN